MKTNAILEQLQAEFETAQKHLASAERNFDGSPAARQWVVEASYRLKQIQAEIDNARKAAS